MEALRLRLLDLLSPADLDREIAALVGPARSVEHPAAEVISQLVRIDRLEPATARLVQRELVRLGGAVIASAREEDPAAPVSLLLQGSVLQLETAARNLQPASGAAADLSRQLLAALAGAQGSARGSLRVRDLEMDWGRRTWVMGIVNATPDSFSGDGIIDSTDRESSVEAAVAQTARFVAAGVDIVDVGGESTRPGAAIVAADQEVMRVLPVITAIRHAYAVPISVDSWKASVALAALDAGADLVNDVWGLRLPQGGWNTDLARVVAERRVPIILMHNRRAMASDGHYRAVHYDDLMGEIMAELQGSVEFALAEGIAREHIIVDPGIGFGKTPSQNIDVLRRLGELRSLNLPILLGTSRKSFIGRVLGLPPEQRSEGTGATVALGIERGADIVRVHDVAAMVRVARMTDAIVRPARSTQPSC